MIRIRSRSRWRGSRTSPTRTRRPTGLSSTDALAEARAAGADDALLVNEGGYVTECAIWTLFWWEGDLICTPALMLGILPGVARARIAELAGDLAERRVRVGDIEGRSLFVANAVRGVVPVRSFQGHPVPQNPGTSRLSASFWS